MKADVLGKETFAPTQKIEFPVHFMKLEALDSLSSEWERHGICLKFSSQPFEEKHYPVTYRLVACHG